MDAANANRVLVKPKILEVGDTIGIISPSSRPDPAFLEAGAAWLKGQGFQVILGQHVLDSRGYLAGRDADRAEDLQEMFLRDDVQAIWCAQGGYGSMRVLSLLDYSVIRANPKIFVGYSDITGFHAAFHREASLVTFHGPLVAHEIGRDFTDYTRLHVLKTLMSTDVPVLIENESDSPPALTITSGVAEGPIVGGNLSLLANLMGTPYEPDFTGAIVFLEDVGEAPYRIDRMLTQMLLSGKLQKANGVIIGECADCVPTKPDAPSLLLEEVFTELIAPLQVPAFYGLPIGHGRHKAVIPMGVQARMDADSARLTILESGVKII
jgi:muramoyltetrapeptide carboxypeptidase